MGIPTLGTKPKTTHWESEPADLTFKNTIGCHEIHRCWTRCTAGPFLKVPPPGGSSLRRPKRLVDEKNKPPLALFLTSTPCKSISSMDQGPVMAKGRIVGHPCWAETHVQILGHTPLKHFSSLDKGTKVRPVGHPWGGGSKEREFGV